MKTLAAILVEPNKLELADLEIPALQPGQVLVEIAYSGVCATQLGEIKGTRGPDPYLPHCLGHEASGYVRHVGPGVWKVKRDDKVVCSWLKGSGQNVAGVRYAAIPGGVPASFANGINAGAITTWQRFAVLSENRVWPMPIGLDMKYAAFLGCPIATGVGAVWNTAQARAGQSMAVFGCGGVGCCAIAGAEAAGCYPITAFDVDKDKLAAACHAGADRAIQVFPDTASDDVGSAPVDIAIESSGRPQAMQAALAAVKAQGGIAVILGNAPTGVMLSINPRALNDGKQLRGCWGGDSIPDRDFPRYAQMLLAGKLNVLPLVSTIYPLEKINEAVADFAAGKVLRPLLDMKG